MDMANNEQFSRSLTLLRKEKGVSQRSAAKELGISQALLSHYENGIREPGLAFVVKAGEYCGVAAGFRLGRGMSRDGATIGDAGSLYDASADRDNILKGSVVALLSKKLLVNSMSVLFDLLGKMGNKRAITAVADYLGTSIYVMFRHLYEANPENSSDFFSVTEGQFKGGLSRADMIFSEVELVEALKSETKTCPPPAISNQTLSESYPGTYQSILQIIHNTGNRLRRQLEARGKE
jgi:transcriptional regulator with XRE-family HTH domain